MEYDFDRAVRRRNSRRLETPARDESQTQEIYFPVGFSRRLLQTTIDSGTSFGFGFGWITRAIELSGERKENAPYPVRVFGLD